MNIHVTGSSASGDRPVLSDSSAGDQPSILLTPGSIIKCLQMHADQETPIRLCKLFKGLPIDLEIKVISTTPHITICQVLTHPVYPLTPGPLLLKSPLFERPVVAFLSEVNLQHGLYVLTEMFYSQINQWNERCSIRVQPTNPTYVTLKRRRPLLRGALENISLNGLALIGSPLTDSTITEVLPLNVSLEMRLSSEHYWEHIRGALVNAREVGSGLARYGVRLYLNTVQRLQLQGYLAKRQAEIMDELDQTYLAAWEPQVGENPFF
jgi:hypothetical protein